MTQPSEFGKTKRLARLWNEGGLQIRKAGSLLTSNMLQTLVTCQKYLDLIQMALQQAS